MLYVKIMCSHWIRYPIDLWRGFRVQYLATVEMHVRNYTNCSSPQIPKTNLCFTYVPVFRCFVRFPLSVVFSGAFSSVPYLPLSYVPVFRCFVRFPFSVVQFSVAFSSVPLLPLSYVPVFRCFGYDLQMRIHG